MNSNSKESRDAECTATIVLNVTSTKLLLVLPYVHYKYSDRTYPFEAWHLRMNPWKNDGRLTYVLSGHLSSVPITFRFGIIVVILKSY